MDRKRVLFLCTGNSARSQMAEGLVNHFLANNWRAYSAGVAPAARVHPFAIRAMAELGIDISAQQPKSVEDFRGQDFDAVVTLCDHAAATCPLWLGGGRRAHIAMPDPAIASGSKAEQMAVFRRVRDDLREQVFAFLNQASEPDTESANHAATFIL
jgi:arsenate reductase